MRTKGIWFVFSFELFSFILGILSKVLIDLQVIKLPVNEQVYMDSLGKMSYVFTLFSLIGFIGAVRLFLLKRDATIYYFVRFLGSIFAVFYNVFFTNWLLTHDVLPSIVGTLVGLGIQFGFLFYAVKVKKSGLLR